MPNNSNYIHHNRLLWNAKTAAHIQSDFYDLPGFLAGKTSLKSIELDLLGHIEGKHILHLQCHFGQDTISLARMGAAVVGVDFSDVAIAKARELAIKTKANASFIESDVLDFIGKIDQRFDTVFITYGTIGWLHDLNLWAKTIAHYLKPGGELIFVEGHPVLWMMDEQVNEVKYRYFNAEPIIETTAQSYTDHGNHEALKSISWNHGLAEVFSALTQHGIAIEKFEEFDYFPYPIFEENTEFEPGKFRPAKHAYKLPLTYSFLGKKSI